MSTTTHMHFKCATCPATHAVEVEQGAAPSNEWPLGWMLLRTRGVGLHADLERVYCTVCREPLLKLMGFDTYKNYVAVVKATAEIEEQQARKRFEAARAEAFSKDTDYDPSSLN